MAKANLTPEQQKQVDELRILWNGYEEKKREIFKDRPGGLMTPDGRKPEVSTGFSINIELVATDEGYIAFKPVPYDTSLASQEAPGDTNEGTGGIRLGV